uniref:Uncharacterized protein n=1 Tax=Aegilops tauschii subsp. strangulata TaxID=200361 RepID=A0A453BZD7_AEGTS
DGRPFAFADSSPSQPRLLFFSPWPQRRRAGHSKGGLLASPPHPRRRPHRRPTGRNQGLLLVLYCRFTVFLFLLWVGNP